MHTIHRAFYTLSCIEMTSMYTQTALLHVAIKVVSSPSPSFFSASCNPFPCPTSFLPPSKSVSCSDAAMLRHFLPPWYWTKSEENGKQKFTFSRTRWYNDGHFVCLYTTFQPSAISAIFSKLSKISSSTFGVPQGTIFAPVVFLVHRRVSPWNWEVIVSDLTEFPVFQ